MSAYETSRNNTPHHIQKAGSEMEMETERFHGNIPQHRIQSTKPLKTEMKTRLSVKVSNRVEGLQSENKRN